MSLIASVMFRSFGTPSERFTSMTSSITSAADRNPGIVPPWLSGPGTGRNPGIVPPWLQRPITILPIEEPITILPVDEPEFEILPVDETQFVSESAVVSPTSLADILRGR